MPSKVKLDVFTGLSHRQEHVFEERTTCIIGRAADCHPRLPDDEQHRQVSRHHCLLDINPPDIRIRDFGSMNGTFVNGKLIGQRDQGMTAEEGAQLVLRELDLKDGDEIRVGYTRFKVRICVPAICSECSAEIPEDRRAKCECAPGVYQCDSCRVKAQKEGRHDKPKKKPKLCARCGKDVSREIGENRQGEYVCASCRADPSAILRDLMSRGRSGDGRHGQQEGSGAVLYRRFQELQ